MQAILNFQISNKLYLKNPQDSDLGRDIVIRGIDLMYDLGYEKFTFKKLASHIGTTEATVYRYFENKHMFLVYIIDIYWSILHFTILSVIKLDIRPEEKLGKTIDLLIWEDNQQSIPIQYDLKKLFYIAVQEGSKTYLSKDVDQHNTFAFYAPFKELCELIASIITEINPDYPHAISLASMLLEGSHTQYFFMQHFSRLSNFYDSKDPKSLEKFLFDMVIKTLS